jgi:membrane protease subunit HflC
MNPADPNATAPEESVRSSPAATVLRIVVSLVVVGMLLLYGSSFSVREGNQAIVTRFGKPVREIADAGRYWKYPWPIEQVHEIDVRSRFFNTPFTATFTRDRKNVVLLAYVVWRVENAGKFFQSLGTPEAAEGKLEGMVAAAKNFHMGNYELSALVSTLPGAIKAAEVEDAVLRQVQPDAKEKFGILVEQVGIKRIAYPQENMPSVLEQMRAERRAEAGEMRAKGKMEAQRIQDEGLVKAEEILRKGREEAGKIRGQAEREAAEIYAQAHQLDPDFYRFWKSMQVLKKTLGDKATVILRNDLEPFDRLFEPSRGPAGSSPRSVPAPGAASVRPGSQGAAP